MSIGSVATIALVTALTVSAASIGAEVFFAIDKCCTPEPQACKDSDEFNRIEKELEPLSHEIDVEALECKEISHVLFSV